MSRPALLFVCVVALGAGILGLAFVEEPEGLRGGPHPELTSMRRGGDGQARHRSLLVPGWLLGCGIILCFSAFVHFGALRGRGRERLSLLLKAATALYVGCWSWLIWVYRASLDDATPGLILTLPRPTALMIFVFWPTSMLFSALFVLGFNRWVLTDEEDAAFRRLVERRREREDRRESQ